MKLSMGQNTVLNVVLSWILIFAFCLGCGWYYYNKGAKSFSLEQGKSKISLSQSLIHLFISKEKDLTRKKFNEIRKFQPVADYVDYGQKDLLDAQIKALMPESSSTFEYRIYDFEGEIITDSSSSLNELDKSKLTSMIGKALEGVSSDDILFLDKKIVVAYVGPIGLEKEPSGALLLVHPFDQALRSYVETYAGTHVAGVYQGKVLLTDQEDLFSAFLSRLPRRGKIIFDGDVEEETNKGLVGLLNSKEAFSTPDVRWLVAYPVTSMEFIGGELLRPFFVLSLILLLGTIAVLLFFLTPLIRGFREVQKGLDAVGVNLATPYRFPNRMHTLAFGVPLKINHLLDAAKARIGDVKKEEKASEEKLSRLQDLIAVDDVTFKMFLDSVSRQRGKNESYLKELSETEGKAVPQWRDKVDSILRLVRAIRDDANIFGLDQIANQAQIFEDNFTKLSQGREQPPLMIFQEMAQGFANLSNEITNYVSLRRKTLGRDVESVVVTEVTNTQIFWLSTIIGRLLTAFRNPYAKRADLSGLLKELDHALASVGRVDMRSFIKRYDFLLTHLSEKSSKKIKPIKLTGDFPYVPIGYLLPVHDMLVAGFKNALEHGIEGLIKRVKLKKSEEGEISLHMERKGEFLEIIIRDDGKGITTDEIKEEMLRRKIASEEEIAAFSEEEFMQVLFKEGFSTVVTSSSTWGKGLGLSTIWRSAHELNGQVEMISSGGIGSVLKISLPIPVPRFLAHYSLFDARMLIGRLFRDKAEEAKKQNVKLNFVSSSDERFLVYAYRQVFFDAIRSVLKIFFLQYEVPITLNVKLEKVNLTGSPHQIVTVCFFVDGQKDVVKTLFQTQRFKDLVESLSEEPGFSFRVDPSTDRFNLDVMTNLPATYEQKPIQIAFLCQEFGHEHEVIKDYLERDFGGWPYSILSQKDADASQVDVASSVVCVFVEDDFIHHGKGGMDLLLRDDIHTLTVVSKDIAGMDSALAGRCTVEPSVMELPLEPFGIEEALEATLVRGVFNL